MIHQPFKRFVARLVLGVLSLGLLTFACTSTGDKEVQGQAPAKGSLCAQYCEKAEASGCVVSATCEADCQGELRAAPDCVGLGDDYYSCAAGHDVPCAADGGPAVASACSAQAADLLDCLEGVVEPGGPMGNDCQAEADACVNACFDQYPAALDLFAVELECGCQPENCLDACASYCLDAPDMNSACAACWDAHPTCGEQALDYCNTQPECVAGVRCVIDCPTCPD